MKHVLVTGGNSGIGFALCGRLVRERGCKVFLGSRSKAKGEEAVRLIVDGAGSSGSDVDHLIEYVQIDVASSESVALAADAVGSKLGPAKLYAVVNNAGTGFKHDSPPGTVVDTNLYGPRRVCDAFLPLLSPEKGRIVNVGSGAGPGYVSRVRDSGALRLLCCGSEEKLTLNWIDSYAKSAFGGDADSNDGYGLSKALLSCYTAMLAREHPNIISSCISPGFVDTKMTKGKGGGLTPDEGTVSIMYCLFEELKGNGYYYGSDALRSPYHFMRDPGTPEYDGKLPF